MIPSRRSFILGAAASIITAPAIVRAGSLMPIKTMIERMRPMELMELAETYQRFLLQAETDQRFLLRQLLRPELEWRAFQAWSSGPVFRPTSLALAKATSGRVNAAISEAIDGLVDPIPAATASSRR